MSLKANLRNRQTVFTKFTTNRLPELIPNSGNLSYSTWINMQVSSGTRTKDWATNKLNTLAKRRAKNKSCRTTNSKKRK